MSKLVAGSDNEIFECVIGIQIGIEKSAMFGTAFMRGASHELIGGVLKNIFDLEGIAKKLYGTFVYQAEIMEREPILEIGIGYLDVETVAFLSDINGGIEPSLVTIPVDFSFNSVFDKKPRV
jgi:hypothetical protein